MTFVGQGDPQGQGSQRPFFSAREYVHSLIKMINS